MSPPPEGQRMPVGLLLSALAVRILLMPLALHSDLLFIQYFPTYLSAQGHWDVYGRLGEHFLGRGFTYYPPMVLYTIACFQKVFAVWAPDFPRLIEQFHASFYAGTSADMGVYWEGFGLGQRLAVTAWMKLPYLVADAAVAGILLRGWNTDGGRSALRFWLWSPVALYATYLFGQYRIVSCAVIMAALWMSRSGREKSFYLLLGVAGLYENFVWVLIPFVVLARTIGPKGIVKAIACVAIVPAAVLGPLVLSSGPLALYSYASPVITKAASTGILRSYPDILPAVCKVLLAACLGAVLVTVLRYRRLQSGLSAHQATVLVCVAVLLSVYATSVTMVHYFLWVMPFVLVMRAEGIRPAVSGRVFVVMTALLFMFNIDSPGLHAGLFTPVVPDLTGPALHDALAPLPWGKVIAASRVLFSMLCLYTAVAAMAPLRSRPIDPASATGV